MESIEELRALMAKALPVGQDVPTSSKDIIHVLSETASYLESRRDGGAHLIACYDRATSKQRQLFERAVGTLQSEILATGERPSDSLSPEQRACARSEFEHAMVQQKRERIAQQDAKEEKHERFMTTYAPKVMEQRSQAYLTTTLQDGMPKPCRHCGIVFGTVSGRHLHELSCDGDPSFVLRGKDRSDGPRSQYTGVTPTGRRRNPWKARCAGVELGAFPTELQAAEAYNQEAGRRGLLLNQLVVPVAAGVEAELEPDSDCEDDALLRWWRTRLSRTSMEAFDEAMAKETQPYFLKELRIYLSTPRHWSCAWTQLEDIELMLQLWRHFVYKKPDKIGSITVKGHPAGRAVVCEMSRLRQDTHPLRLYFPTIHEARRMLYHQGDPTATYSVLEKLIGVVETFIKELSNDEVRSAEDSPAARRAPPSDDDDSSDDDDEDCFGAGKKDVARREASRRSSELQDARGSKDSRKKAKTTSRHETSRGDVSSEDELPERLKGCDPELVKLIEREIMHSGAMTTFDDVAGLQDAKRSIMEMVIWPMQRPELFTGLRAVPKGMLLFGPPGTGKTLIGRAIASSSGATFFSISASSLMSKWIGESEKLVRTMFAVAGHKEPSVVFIDEVDSLLSQRSSDENEASRRLKTEFLVQLEGVGSGDASNRERVLVVGATNRPQELDEAARRRFVKRFYVPLPDDAARRSLLGTLLKDDRHSLSPAELDGALVDRTRGFSGADIRDLCRDAAMGPMRDLFAGGGGAPGAFRALREDQIPPISFAHFDNALKITRATVAPDGLVGYEAWDAQFGSAVRG